MNTDDLNEICRKIAEDSSAMNISMLVEDIMQAEEDEEMLALGPYAFGPDFDEGSNDCDGEFYWDK